MKKEGELYELALFAGAGGGILGGKLLGWRTVCAVERDAYAAAVLAQRQNDGLLEPFPIWSDVTTFDGRPWNGIVDVISGGFPCQDISVAGKGAGLKGERSGLWREFARIIREVRPRHIFVENSPALTIRGLDVVLGDLASMGYDAKWGVLGAIDAGAPHRRERIWIRANMADTRCKHGSERNTTRMDSKEKVWTAGTIYDQSSCQGLNEEQTKDVGNSKSTGLSPCVMGQRKVQLGRTGSRHSWWEVEPDLGRVANGVAFMVDRLKAIGNGQVSEVARRAWEMLA